MEISSDDNKFLDEFFDFAINNNEYECEAIFTDKKKLTSEKFKEVFQYLSNNDYDLINTNDNESLDIIINQKKYQKYRISLTNNNEIMNYCKTNKFKNAFYGIKQSKKINGKNKIELTNYNFRINLKKDTVLDNEDNIEEINNIIHTSLKSFRFKKRFSFLTKSKFFRIDLTLVKSGKKSTTFFESGILQDKYPKYEFEIEFINKDIKKDQHKKDLINELFKIMGNILLIIEGNNFIIKEDEKKKILEGYLKLAYNLSSASIKKLIFYNPKKYFIGVQPVTLQKENLLIDNPISITKNYSVTDKADGERNLLYISGNNGKIYLIDNRLNIKYTGLYCDENEHYNSILDGEYVTTDKYGSNVANYLAFDIYFHNNSNVSNLPLISDKKSRLNKLEEILKKENIKSINNSKFKLEVKTFLTGDKIFENNKQILDNKGYSYKRDGLIFTPINLPVGAKNEGDKQGNLSETWYRAFKWKPPEENTIDFLVEFNGDIKEGSRMYKYCNLLVGYNEDIEINIFEILKHKFTDQVNGKYEFAKCYLEITDNKVLSEENEQIDNNMIVEFRYDDTNEQFLRWIPYRIRYDKTELYRITNDISNTANYYTTAQRVFNTIENPITTDMITDPSGSNITIELVNKEEEDNDVYYMRENDREDSLTRPLLDFHNFWVKDKFLYNRFSGSESLFDIASAKGGDLRKWVKSGFQLVIGTDLSEDNIYNVKDGIYKRYIQLYKKGIIKDSNKMIFVQLDASKKWTKEYINTLKNEEMQKLNKIIFGFKDKKDIQQGDGMLVKFHNKINEKFNLVSCMFAIHYMFESNETLTNLVSNIDLVLKKGGYFFGTCLDGQLLSKKLENKDEIKAERNNKLLWRIQKKYEDFSDDNFINNYGKKITVYMETINQDIEEYLVDYRLLKYKLGEKNILPLKPDDLSKLKLDSSTDTFKYIYNKNKKQIEKDSNKKNMDNQLKDYSFLNRWFIFKKY
jgi:hypothetical protein